MHRHCETWNRCGMGHTLHMHVLNIKVGPSQAFFNLESGKTMPLPPSVLHASFKINQHNISYQILKIHVIFLLKIYNIVTGSYKKNKKLSIFNSLHITFFKTNDFAFV